MGRARNPDRDKAKEIWLKSPDTIKLKDIATELGYPENTIRKWKCEDGWEKERSDKKKKNAPNPKKKRGAPKGNTNAVGHGAPLGNQNAFKHGGYSAILFDALDETEQSLIEQMQSDEEQLLIDEINLLTVRERRILRRIEEYSKRPMEVYGVIRAEVKRSFANEDEEALYNERIREKVENGERLPGKDYRTQTTTEASYSIILKLEEALTRCQQQKQRAIDSLNKIRMAKDDGKSHDIEDMYVIRKVVFGNDGNTDT